MQPLGWKVEKIKIEQNWGFIDKQIMQKTKASSCRHINGKEAYNKYYNEQARNMTLKDY